MANGFRITAIILMIIGCVSILDSFSKYQSSTILQQQYYALASIQTGVQGLFFVALAIFFLLMGYTRDNKKK